MNASANPPAPCGSTIAFSIQDMERAAAQRAPGYLVACRVAAVTVEPSALVLRREDYDRIRREFGHGRPPVLDWPAPPGLGDHVQAWIHPLARLLDWALGTSFATCRACQRRAAWLNACGRRLRRLRYLWGSNP